MASAVAAARESGPPVAVLGCDGLLEVDVERALGVELVGNDASSGVLAVEVACARPDRGIITVRRVGAPPSTRTIAFGDVELDARPRVVALVIAETLPYVRADLAGPTRVAATFEPDHGALALGASGTMRAFTRGGAFLFGGQLDVSHGRFLLGASVTGGAHDDPLGALHPWVLAGVASVDLLCGRHPVEVCLAARVDAGYAFATAARSDPSTTSRNVDAPYLQLSGALRAALPAGRAGLSLDAVAGWAEGLVVTADRREAVRLAGPVVMVSVGARVWP